MNRVVGKKERNEKENEKRECESKELETRRKREEERVGEEGSVEKIIRGDGERAEERRVQGRENKKWS